MFFGNYFGMTKMTDKNSNEMKRKPSFSIEDILSPNFGNFSKQLQELKPSLVPENKDRLKSSVVPMNPKVPAWIFCTRYSDRPASGNLYGTALRDSCSASNLSELLLL